MTRYIAFFLMILSYSAFSVESIPLLNQSQLLPEGFRDYFFGTPLIANIVIDNKQLGSGELILSREGKVYLLNLLDSSESQFNTQETELWKQKLSKKLTLGACGSDCPSDVLMIDYSLEKSQLTVVTQKVELQDSDSNYRSLPEENPGLIMRNQLRLSSEGKNQTSMLNFQLEGNIRTWTLFSEGDITKTDSSQNRIRQAYVEQLSEKYYTRLGYFIPNSQGLVQQLNYFSAADINIIGAMFGNSDLLRKEQKSPSLVPIQITTSRPGIAEIYKNGQLLNSQLIQSGLQVLDTRALPAGIYEIVIRILEDGQETQRKTEMVYKPSSWTTPEDAWRYNLYAGWQVPVWGNSEADNTESALTMGGEFNHLLTPSMIVGFGNRYADKRFHQSLSLDWNITPSLRWLSTLNHSEGVGWGYNAQSMITLNRMNMVLGHTARHLNNDDDSTAYLSMQYPMLGWGSVDFYLSHQSGQGSGANLSWKNAERWQGEWINWDVTLFDRPGTLSTNDKRDRGAMLSFSVSFGSGNKSLSLGVGSRTSRSGEKDQQLSLNYQQQTDLGIMKQVSVGMTHDRYGSGFSGYGRYSADWVDGDAFVQNSSYNKDWSYGVNMDSSFAISREGGAIGGGSIQQDAALILDIDADRSDARLRISSDNNGDVLLGSGRHLFPVSALENGTLQLDSADQYTSTLAIQPAIIPYYLNRGGVGYHKVQVTKTVTVIGRLVDEHNQGLGGAKVINHVGRTISDPDGFFVVDVSLKDPSVTVESPKRNTCNFSLGDFDNWKKQETIMVGDLLCRSEMLASKK
ncbi:hypothetical protein FXE62_15055 [Vibrio cholerae]|uniref:TcfC E-set like domain-containing protein n=1 Tax=Vibrio cholerae TaxID=666 RepID=UPI0011D42B0F|nr:CS1-pili formation C-terminal domain-containing protein [Vibrio cholerae]TXZ02601.1 hypothetical protein FXE62_15055 [Vibrio cholerae]GHY13416.1 putative outer membrane usher protein EcpC [Vibrio cholerae]